MQNTSISGVKTCWATLYCSVSAVVKALVEQLLVHPDEEDLQRALATLFTYQGFRKSPICCTAFELPKYRSTVEALTSGSPCYASCSLPFFTVIPLKLLCEKNTISWMRACFRFANLMFRFTKNLAHKKTLVEKSVHNL